MNVTDGGTTNTTSFSSSATLFSATPWTAASNPSPDSLSTYLGISASPTNGFSTYAGSNTPGGNNIADPTATGYDVYTDDLGQNNLTSQSAGGSGAPQLNIPGGLPMGSYILGFLNEGTAANPDWLATANSEALLQFGWTIARARADQSSDSRQRTDGAWWGSAPSQAAVNSRSLFGRLWGTAPSGAVSHFKGCNGFGKTISWEFKSSTRHHNPSSD